MRAILAALVAESAYLPRKFPTVDVRSLRDFYGRADPAFTQLFPIGALAEFASKSLKAQREKNSSG